ncbi:MAG: PIN domain-containing protein [Micropruina sp.]|uniref:PIN domain-containing protein n=1 Tax=Micropruina sp. TaxID=2737536 RepID=UPI0039E5FBB3
MTAAIVDTSAILALFDEGYAEHPALARLVSDGSWDLIVSPFVVAEVDYMLATRLGSAAAGRFHHDLLVGAYHLAPWRVEDHALAVKVGQRFGSEYVGVADAANVVLAATYRTNILLTLDQRHFRALSPMTSDAAFRLLPYDV